MFTLAMIGNPHVWKRAQAENDAVVGTGRLPEFDDRPSLPYVGAIMRDGYRFYPLVRVEKQIPFPSVFLNIQQAARTQLQLGDAYKGYYIPKGMLHHLPVVVGVPLRVTILIFVW